MGADAGIWAGAGAGNDAGPSVSGAVGCDTLPGTVRQMNPTTASATVTIEAAATNGSHDAKAKAAPAAAAATAVKAV
jgi:hypothetical protein